MERRSIIFILLAVFFSACEDISKSDLEGSWHRVYETNSSPEINIGEISFSEDSIDLIDGDYPFKESGTYRIKKDELLITRNDGYEIITKIKDVSKGSMVLFDSIQYKRLSSEPFYGDSYELTGIETNEYLSQIEGRFTVIQMYKTENGELKLRLNDKITDYRDLPMFFHRGCRGGLPINNPVPSQILLFIGKGVKLSDLKTLYFHIPPGREMKEVLLVTQRKGSSDFYIFKDKFYIWWNELEEYLTEFYTARPPFVLPPPPPTISKTDFLNNGGKDIKIDSKSDFRKIDKLTKEDTFQISISSTLDFKDYIALKKKLRAYKNQKGIHYFTVIY